MSGIRFERGLDRSDEAVLADLLDLAVATPERLLAGGDFGVTVAGGTWIGEPVRYRGKPFLSARTFCP